MPTGDADAMVDVGGGYKMVAGGLDIVRIPAAGFVDLFRLPEGLETRELRLRAAGLVVVAAAAADIFLEREVEEILATATMAELSGDREDEGSIFSSSCWHILLVFSRVSLDIVGSHTDEVGVDEDQMNHRERKRNELEGFWYSS